MRGIHTALLICLSLAGTAVSEQVARAAPEAPRFEHLLPEDGLSSPAVYSILQDRTGFLWLGTEGGLNRYDGYAFEIFRHDPDEPGSVASDDISFLYQDGEGILWIATWGGGLDRFDPVSETFRHFPPDPSHPDRLPDGRVQHLYEDSQGVLWVATYSGLSRFDRAAETFTTLRHDPEDPTSLSHDRVWRILEDKRSIFWVATEDGLCILDRATGTFERFRHDPEDPTSLSHDVVRTLFSDAGGVLWAGTAGGLDRFDRATGAFERFRHDPDDAESLSHNVITALYEDHRGTFWVGTRAGLNVFDRGTGRSVRLRRDSGSLSDDDIRAILEDTAGVLWIATRAGGLNKLDTKPAKFQRSQQHRDPQGAGDAYVRAFAEDRQGRLWLGTGAGVARLDATAGADHERLDAVSLPTDDVHHLLIDGAGDLWVAAGSGGLGRLTPAATDLLTYRHDPLDPGTLSGDRVSALFEDRSRFLWVGTTSGLDRFDPQRQAVERFGDRAGGRGGVHVTALFEDASGNLWIGTHDGGLLRLDVAREKFERFTNDPDDPTTLSNDRVFSIHQQASGELWIGTAAGLNELRSGDTFRRYLKKDGLANPRVVGILSDAGGHLWLSTSGGLSRFDPRPGTFRNYTSRDGLQSDQFNAGAYLKRRDGRLCFGGSSGFNCFQPDDVRDNPHIPPVVLTALRKHGERVSLSRAAWAVEAIRLEPGDNYFSFEYAALDFSRPEDNRYRYRLEGFDSDWIEAGSRRSASYANVAPGDYVFRVQGSNADAVWNEAGLSIDVTLVPPFWQTVWFLSLAAVALMALGIGGWSYRTRLLKQREQRHDWRVEEGLADLHRSEKRYRLLFERNLAGVVRATGGGRVLDCNEAFAKIFGYDSRHQCRRDHALKLDDAFLAQLRRDGSVVSHESSTNSRDGSTLSLLWNASLADIEDVEGGVIEGTVIDVSERRRIEDSLRRAAKLESLGVLAGGIAHDFNNLLMSILGNAELARAGLEPGSSTNLRLGRIEQAAQRAADLAKQMLAYSGKGEFIIISLDLSAAVLEIAHLLEETLSKKAQIDYRLDPDPPTIEADAGQVGQIVMNLITNASEALGDGAGTITVTTGTRICDRDDLADTYLDDQLIPGRYVFLEVHDNGSGMDEETLRKIFDPFFTTKFTGRGLGLAAVLGIVRGHSGAIKIDTEPGRGSTFTVLFPASDKPVTVAAQTDSVIAADSWRGRGKVLVVDDDASVRAVVREMVEMLGFEVETAVDGRDGVETFRRLQDEIVLVILDLAMPEMDGEEALREIRRISSEARVILASGYDEQESVQLFANLGLAGFIQKPYRLAALRDKIRDGIEGPGSP